MFKNQFDEVLKQNQLKNIVFFSGLEQKEKDALIGYKLISKYRALHRMCV